MATLIHAGNPGSPLSDPPNYRQAKVEEFRLRLRMPDELIALPGSRGSRPIPNTGAAHALRGRTV